jgi:hypothetical protein
MILDISILILFRESQLPKTGCPNPGTCAAVLVSCSAYHPEYQGTKRHLARFRISVAICQTLLILPDLKMKGDESIDTGDEFR